MPKLAYRNRRLPLILAATLLATAGGSGAPPRAPPERNAARAVPASPAGGDAPAENAVQAAPKEASAERPALAGLSPRQRHAYQKGYADCRAGRYDPDPYPEAYRIGCAAAHGD
jgi:hypothetical protein